MARNTKLKKKKSNNGRQKISFTRAELDMLLKHNSRQILKGAKSLLEYNMIIENHLTPAEAKRQGELMDIRAEAIINGDLTWEEIDAFLDEYYAKEEAKDGNEAGETMA